MIIDATNLIIGRLSTIAAKELLRGNKVDIINSEKAVITGTKSNIQERYKAKFDRGSPFHGPYRSRRPDLFLKRTIRGMLPHKQPKGREALKLLRCHIGIPSGLKDKKSETIKQANITKTQSLRYLSVEQVCNFLGER
jgi:large subunit ribosomal protein L13